MHLALQLSPRYTTTDHWIKEYYIKRIINCGLFWGCRKKTAISHGRLNRWTSQLDLGSMSGGSQRVVSVHNIT